jgi:pantothenate synthetase (EC 6.3.2.1)
LFQLWGTCRRGHLKLVREAKRFSDVVVVSIFVNPTQFAKGEDYESYPRDEKRDLEMLKKEKVNFVFIPDVKEMYKEDFKTYVEVMELQDELCGKFRPGHFRGVATVVAKLFNIVKPHIAFFGLKDYQQYVILKKMVEDLNFDIKIKPVETVRDKDGVALSSRNTYLSEDERKLASLIPSSLILAKDMIFGGEEDAEKIKNAAKDFLNSQGITNIDYFEISDPDTLHPIKKIDRNRKNCLIAVAVRVGKARLIDNIVIRNGKIFNLPKIKEEKEKKK